MQIEFTHEVLDASGIKHDIVVSIVTGLEDQHDEGCWIITAGPMVSMGVCFDVWEWLCEDTQDTILSTAHEEIDEQPKSNKADEEYDIITEEDI